ncbi:MAG: hypothetical protein KDE55_05290 [Novosphingobium sp.]|nr:hypothetical protein [Novosphingobium sp.]
MIHILLHFAVPLAVALVFYRPSWRSAALIMAGTMLVDADHLLANPIYDPDRCSIGFHPLHSGIAIVGYMLLFLVPVVVTRMRGTPGLAGKARVLQLVGSGLVLHMALDAIDCRF